ncbi:hypothetical protein F5Y08DRAFT_344921 [Xylaria arbuscula]|nr:hypothetical protein F5Y08DRAFT_344921 [Xylaria arbuscula]
MATNIPSSVDLCSIPAGPPPDGVVSNFVYLVDLTKETLGVSIVFAVLASVFVAGRIIWNWRKMALADYMTMAALILTVAYDAVVAALVTPFSASVKSKVGASTVISSFITRIRGSTGDSTPMRGDAQSGPTWQKQPIQGRRKNSFYYELGDSVLNTTVIVEAEDVLDRPTVPGIIDENGILKTTQGLQESRDV